MKAGNAFCLALMFAASLLFAGFAGAAELKFNTQNFEPFNYEVNGVVAGPTADIIRKVCAEMKITCTLNLLPWRRAQEEVANGIAQGLFTIGWNEERAKTLYFSPTLMNTQYGFFVRNDNPLKFKHVSDVKGYTVGVFGPSNTSFFLEKIRAEIKDLTIDMTPEDESAFKKLSLGRVDAVYSNKDVGYFLMGKLNIKNIRYAGFHTGLKYYVGFSQKFTDKKLVDQFNATFRNLHKRGVIQEILAKHKMDAAPLE
jgi:polar amino acid transport system substrate-binding protein